MNKFLKILLVFDILVVNLALSFLIYTIYLDKLEKVEVVPTGQRQLGQNSGVTIDINQKLDLLDKRVGDLELTPYPSPAGSSGQIKTITVTSAPAKKALTETTVFYNIPGSGQTNKIEWTDISGTEFYFDKADYKGLKTITMEASIKLFNGNGIGYVRLWDSTHGFAVVGSEVSTSSQNNTLVSSGTMNLWNGKNLYKIQGKSNSSDWAVYNWGKLKIVTQQ